MSPPSVPSNATVLVIGGGPSGSYAAAVLARRNIDVVLLEAAKFPRYHIGESLLASSNYFLEYIDVREKILKAGFVRKPGGAFKLRKDFPEAYTNFIDHNTGNHALNVVRSKYDDILFRHAGEEGAKIFDEHKVTSLQFSDSDPNRPIAAHWESKSGTKGTINFDYLIDASGRQGILSTKYHKDRKMSVALKNSAIWAYWKTDKWYGEGTERYGAPLIESLHDNTGWAWYIPLTDGTISIGFVMHDEFTKEKKVGKTLEELYLDQFNQVSLVNELKGDAPLLPNKEGKGSPIYQATDYSYAAEDVGKLNYRISGDAAAFIDPFFSSGVHLCFVGALSAALSIISVIDGKSTEAESAEFHNAELKTAFTRFFVVVIAGYKQMRSGIHGNVLNDIDEKSFDRAFGLIRPVIQGTGDVGVDKKSTGNVKLSAEELDGTMDFVFGLMSHGKEHVVSTLPKNDKLGDLDEEALGKLDKFGEGLAYITGHDGVKQVLEQAHERMRMAVAGGGLKPIQNGP